MSERDAWSSDACRGLRGGGRRGDRARRRVDRGSSAACKVSITAAPVAGRDRRPRRRRTSTTRQFCGGVIVDELHVITAAHCLDAQSPAGVPRPATARRRRGHDRPRAARRPLPPSACRSPPGARCPHYDFVQLTPGPCDAALATLSAAARPVRARARARPCSSGSGAADAARALGARVSGWGETEAGQLPAGAAGDRPADRRRPGLRVVLRPGRPRPPDDALRDRARARLVQRRQRRPADARSTATLVGLVSWGADQCASPYGAPGRLHRTRRADDRRVRPRLRADAGRPGVRAADLVRAAGARRPAEVRRHADLPARHVDVDRGHARPRLPLPHARGRARCATGRRARPSRPATVTAAAASSASSARATAPARRWPRPSPSDAGDRPAAPPPADAHADAAPTPAPTPARRPRDVVAPRAVVRLRPLREAPLHRAGPRHRRGQPGERRARRAGHHLPRPRALADDHREGAGQRACTRRASRGCSAAGAWFTASARDRAGNIPATVAIRRAVVR